MDWAGASGRFSPRGRGSTRAWRGVLAAKKEPKGHHPSPRIENCSCLLLLLLLLYVGAPGCDGWEGPPRLAAYASLHTIPPHTDSPRP